MISNLIEAISAKRLGLADVEPDIIGRSYEYLIHKFAEGSVSSAGEFYTPKEVGLLMARIMNPEAWPVSIPLQDPDLDPGYGQRPDVCFLRVLDRTDEEMTSALGLT
jgi:type I restriction-modification system DNA methylase subunit